MFMKSRSFFRNMSQICALSRNVQRIFHKLSDANLDAEDFQNVIIILSCQQIHSFVTSSSLCEVEKSNEQTVTQTDRQTNVR